MSARRWSAAFNVLLKMFAVILAIALCVAVAYPSRDHQGATGPTGAQGIAGADGADGVGEKGDTGANGANFWGSKK